MKLCTLLPALAACLLASAPASSQAPPPVVGGVFSMTNAVAGNEIAVFERDANGLLSPAGLVATNGDGTGADLGSQNSLIVSPNRRWLIAANAGSDEISIFQINGANLQLTDKVPSNGDMPVSLAVRKDVLYVLHAGTPNNVTGFTIDANGILTPIAGSTRPLSAAQTAPAQVGWHPRGDLIIVTEKDTNLLDTFAFDTNTATLGSFQTKASSGPTPFGFAFHGTRQMAVTEAQGGAVDAGSVSTYSFPGTVPEPVVMSLPTTETATCWIVTTPNKKYAYASNTGSDSITGLHSGPNGPVLNDVGGVSANTGDAPTDLALVRNRFLYVLNSLDGTVQGWSIERSDGALTPLQPAVPGLPAVGAAGLAAN